MQKVKVKDHLIQKLEWKQMDTQTDEGNCTTSVLTQMVNV